MNNETKPRESLYLINYPSMEESLCLMEMKCLFGKTVTGKHFVSERQIIPSRSPFIRHVIRILYQAESIEGLVDRLVESDRTFGEYAFVRFKVEGERLDYDEWFGCVARLRAAIDGTDNLEHPGICLGLTRIDGTWVFGEYEKNFDQWKEHDKKPHTNSHSLSVKTAKALVNIAVGHDTGLSVVDPCCGVGTVVIEAASMGITVHGFEINPSIASKAKENLLFFGYSGVITFGTMHEINGHFDVAIIDIPYGLFTPITKEEQDAIIGTARRIADRMTIITFEDMDTRIESAGFEIVGRCHVTKGTFKRHIRLCR